MIRTVIVDDEPPARRLLSSLLHEHDDIEILAECGSPQAAINAVVAHRPDLVFLDVRMPEGDGFHVLAGLGGQPAPAVVFVTAFSEHAVRAFDVDAVDYLLKPYEEQRLRTALERVRAHLGPRPDPAPHPARDGSPPDRIAIEIGGRIHLLHLDRIDYLQAEQGHVRIHAGQKSYLIRDTLTHLAQRLDPATFQRIHRSLIVRLDRIQELDVLKHGELQLRLSSGHTLISSRSYRDQLKTSLRLPI